MKKILTIMISLLALATNVKAEQVTFTVVNNDTEGWPALALYAWEQDGRPDTEIFGSWPGVVLYDGTNLTDNDKVSVTKDGNTFTVTIKNYESTMNLILNNNGNGKQMDLTEFAASKSYEINAPSAQPASFTIVNNDTEGWPALALYSWDNSSGSNVEAFGSWPGVVLYDGTTLTDNEQVAVTKSENTFTVTIKNYETTMNLILNNNNNGKQMDLTEFTEGKSYTIPGTTGISTALMKNERMNHEVYNLNGQRVAQPAKGIYIVNGKAVVVK